MKLETPAKLIGQHHKSGCEQVEDHAASEVRIGTDDAGPLTVRFPLYR